MPSYKAMAEGCTHGDAPPCSAACPYQLDIRKIISRLQRKSFDAVYRLLRDELLFPETAIRLCSEPCRNACVRASTDEPVRLRQLELAAIRHAKSREPLRLNVPKKENHIAVIGAGISGLACALRLSLRGYQVTVYEKNEQIGGMLWSEFPDGAFLEEIQQQFKYTDCRIETSSYIDNLEKIAADAVYIATGRGGYDFRGPRPGVFLGGELLGADRIHALKHGINAATNIEYYVKTKNMPTEEPSQVKSANLPDPWLLKPLPAVEPTGAFYTQDEAVLEAARCLKCDCDICVRRCPMINYYQKFPRRIAEEVEGTVYPTDVFKNRLATRMVASCDQCGLCKESCPNGVDVQSVMLDARREMVSRGAMPTAFSDFWLGDMKHAEECSVVIPRTIGKSGFVFFPGCQLGASDPRYVTGVYKRLLEIDSETTLWVDCCGAPAFWAGDTSLHADKIEKLKNTWESLGRPIPICACPTCAHMLKTHLPECKPVSLYSLELGSALSSIRTASVFDPCASRFDQDAQDGVRKILTDSGTLLYPLIYERENTVCCGWGGQYMIANPEMSRNVVRRNVDMAARTYVTYCTNCRDTFAKEGKDVLHILDVLLGINSPARKPPTHTERRRNRELLQSELTGEIRGETCNMKLYIDQTIAEKIDRDLIIDSDICQVIAECERTGRKIADTKNNCFIGHHKIGFQTYWVVYRPENSGFRILNAYAHRLNILE